jgi:alkyl hydroperoxide reductase subunit AhpF
MNALTINRIISKIKLVNLFAMLVLICFSLQAQQKAVDVLVISGGASGTSAAIFQVPRGMYQCWKTLKKINNKINK